MPRRTTIAVVAVVVAAAVIAMVALAGAGGKGLAPEAGNVSLLTDYDPDAQPGSGVPEPWYGTADGFYDTLTAVEAAMPGVLDRVRELQKESGSSSA